MTLLWWLEDYVSCIYLNFNKASSIPAKMNGAFSYIDVNRCKKIGTRGHGCLIHLKYLAFAIDLSFFQNGGEKHKTRNE